MSRRKFLLRRRQNTAKSTVPAHRIAATRPTRPHCGTVRKVHLLSAVFEHKQTFKAPACTGMLCSQENKKSRTTKAPLVLLEAGGTRRAALEWHVRQCSSSDSCKEVGIWHADHRPRDGFLDQSKPVMVAEERDYRRGRHGQHEPDAFEPRRSCRREIARHARALKGSGRRRIAALCHFQDVSLDEMAIHYRSMKTSSCALRAWVQARPRNTVHNSCNDCRLREGGRH